MAVVLIDALRGIVQRVHMQAVSRFENILLLTFIGETRVLELNSENELEEVDIEGFASDESTIACVNVTGNQYIQVTASRIRLISCQTRTLVAEWTPGPGLRINVAAVNPSQIVVALGGGILMYFEIGTKALHLVHESTLDYEIACVDITPYKTSSPTSTDVCIVGLWTDMSVRVLALQDLKEIEKQMLTTETIPRSLLLVSFVDAYYLLVALGKSV
jgi:DNA damage-binding protein 1